MTEMLNIVSMTGNYVYTLQLGFITTFSVHRYLAFEFGLWLEF